MVQKWLIDFDKNFPEMGFLIKLRWIAFGPGLIYFLSGTNISLNVFILTKFSSLTRAAEKFFQKKNSSCFCEIASLKRAALGQRTKSRSWSESCSSSKCCSCQRTEKNVLSAAP